MPKKIVLLGSLALFTLLLSVLMFGPAVTPAPAQAQEPAVACESDVVVQSVDSLSKLAAKFYGDPKAFIVIVKATNAAAATDSSYAKITDPNVILDGSKLCIPSAAAAQTMMGGQMAAAAEPAAEQGSTPGALAIGDPAIAAAEASCTAAQTNAPWYGTLAPGFNHDSERTGTFECAQFPGSMTEPNVVKALQTSPGYVTPFSTVTRNPEDVYWYAGCTGDAKPPQMQTYLAKVEPGTMKEIWRTNLADASQNGQLHACGAPWTMADGNVLVTSDHTLYKLNGDTGEILAQLDYPTGDNPINDTAANGSDSFADGTIIVKSLNRPVGCTMNGLSAVFACPGGVQAANPSVLSAIDPNTFKVLDTLVLAGNFPSRVTTTNFQGHNYIYLVNLSGQLLRWEWDGQKINPDNTFGAVNYLFQPGQTGGGAPTVMGDWVILNTNGLAVTTTMSIVAISQADPTRVESIELTPKMQPGQVSTSAAKPTVDVENQRIYMADYGTGVVSAIQMGADGKLSMLWQAEQRSNSFTSLIGPADQRVYVATNITATFPITNPSKQLVAGPDGANYTEQYQWRDAATGKLLAASDFYSPAAPGSQIPPGYGGLIYDLLYNGDVVAMYVQPAAEAGAAAAAAPAPTPAPALTAGCTTHLQDGANAVMTQLSRVRGIRYCEISVICGSQAAMYNTTTLNNLGNPMDTCDPKLWAGVDETALAAQLDVPGVWKNGPRFWTNDFMEIATGLDNPLDFNGLKAGWFAYPKYPPNIQNLGITAGAYITTTVQRSSVMTFTAGQPIFIMDDPGGNPWVMQAAAQIVNPNLTYGDLATLDTQLHMPEGWSYRVKTIDQDLVIVAVNGFAQITQDDLGNSYDGCIELDGQPTCNFVP